MRPKRLPLKLLLAAALVAAVIASPAAGAAPTKAQFIASADKICTASNPRDLSTLKRVRALFAKGNEKAGARLLIKAENFELHGYYGKIRALHRPADPALKALVKKFLGAQNGQARERIKFANAVLAGKPRKVQVKYDNRAFHLLQAAAAYAKQIGFHSC